jgi:hypothetical protein
MAALAGESQHGSGIVARLRDMSGGRVALGEYFAHGRLTADELLARLDLALTAVTRRDISLVIEDLPWLHTWPEGGGGSGDLDHPARQDAEAP